jgi:hypothetical protein
MPFVARAQYVQYQNASVSTINATSITPTNASFNGFVDTGGAAASAWFEYGTDLNFGESTTLDAFNWNGGYSGDYSTNISGLTADTTYYFRAVAQNSTGRVYGNVVSFTTDLSTDGNNNLDSPTAITTSGTVLTDNAAQFNALILTGNAEKTDSWFEWGATPNLGNQTATTPLSGSPAIRHTNTITGLAPGTTYYFRAVAQNSFGQSYGDILSLTTSGSAQNESEQNSPNQTNNINKTTSTDTTTVDKTVNENSAVSALGANVAGANSFFPINLLGWLVLLILIFLLVLLGKHAHKQFKK